MLLPLAQSLLCGVCYTSLSPHVPKLSLSHNDGIYSIERTDYPVILVMGTYDMGTLMEFKPLEYPRGAPHPHALKQDAYYL